MLVGEVESGGGSVGRKAREIREIVVQFLLVDGGTVEREVGSDMFFPGLFDWKMNKFSTNFKTLI
jgi:hypothetical protein